MKKFFTLIALFAATVALHAQNKQTIYVWSNNVQQQIIGVDSITFAASSEHHDGGGVTSDALMERLRQVANKFIGKIHSADFTNVSSITDMLVDDDDDAVGEWADDCIDAITNRSGSDYRRLWAASNFTGHFTHNGSRWIKDNGTYNDLQFTMTDKAGRTCIGKVTWSGATRTVHADYFDDEEYEDEWPYNEYKITNQWQIPEHVVATVTQGGTEIARVEVNTTFTSDGDFPTETDANITVNSKVNNYQIVVNKASATGNSKIEAEVTISINGEQLIHATGNADVSYNKSDEKANAGATTIKADVMGEVQINTYTSNLKSYSDNLNIDYDKLTESQAQSRINAANSIANNTLCLDGSNTASATFYYKATQDDDYYSPSVSQYWTPSPVLKIASDGREVAFEDYFSEDNFRSVVDNYDNLVESFKNIFNY